MGRFGISGFRQGFVAATLFALQLACTASVAGTTPSPTSEVVVVEPGGCDTRATLIEADRTYQQQIEATSRPYPANCQYFCLSVPEAGKRLEIGIADFTTDLDLFVGYGEFEAVIGEVPSEDPGRTWKSNQYGLEDEQVTIADAAAGQYYIEVCSFERDASFYELTSRLR
ncbi:MAG: PPC domain-containing protein [Chloroflexota bacterium]